METDASVGRGLETTVIGSYPKPNDLLIPDWFKTGHNEFGEKEFKTFKDLMELQGKETNALVERAMSDCLKTQANIGIDVVTDGEMARENYIYHFCRQLKNFDFTKPTYKVYRNGACHSYVPTIRGVLAHANNTPWCAEEWKRTQSLSAKPVKYTIPGPMTIINSTVDDFYHNDKELNKTLVTLINREVVALSKAGCQHIQIDEPLLVRLPEVALDYGIDDLAKCFEGVDSHVTKTIHLCCGYPTYLDQEDYQKADKNAYLDLSNKLDNAGFDAISLEDAHRHNDLALFSNFKKTKIILGVVKVACSRVETVAEIQERLVEVLRHIPRDRLAVAPDCGLGFLPESILIQKLTNMVKAAKSV